MTANALKSERVDYEVQFYSSREEWLAARVDGIGSSSAAVLWDVSPYESRYSLFQQKVHGIAKPFDEDAEWLEVGSELEPVIANIYARKTGYEISYPGPFVIFRSISRPWMYASLDRVIHGNPKGDGYLECKNRNQFAIKDWNASGAPLEVQIQVMHVLAITGWKWGAIACLFGGMLPRFIEIERDDELIEMHLEKCERFYKDHLLAKVPPEIDGSEHTGAALKLQYPEVRGKAIELPTDAAEWDAKLVVLKKTIKDAEAEASLYQNLLRAAIGDAEAGIIPGGGMYTLRQVKEAQIAATTKKAYRVLKRSK